MPEACRRHHRALACAGLLVGVVALVGGCRAFRCQEISVEKLASARQASLLGIEAQQRGQWDQAEAQFAAAVQQAPKDERARAGYAEALWQRGAQEAAIAQMEEAVRLSGHDPDRRVQLGNMFLARGEFHRAIVQADRAIASNRQVAAAWALRGHALHAQGNRTDALAAFHRALSLQEHFPDVQLAIAAVYRQQDRPQRALATLQALSGNYPAGEAPTEVLLQEGLAYRDLGRYPEAARTLSLAAGRGKPTAELWHELARTRLLAGDVPGARLASNAALALEPTHPASLALTDELRARQGVFTAAAIDGHATSGLSPARRY